MSQHPDEVVEVAEEVPSELVAEATIRHDRAKDESATPQERKQAAVEQAHALGTRPQGSYAQLHETEEATLATPDEQHASALKKDEAERLKADREALKAAQKDQAATDKSTEKAAAATERQQSVPAQK